MTESKRETFCVECEVHLAEPFRPLCPSCADEKARELRKKAS